MHAHGFSGQVVTARMTNKQVRQGSLPSRSLGNPNDNGNLDHGDAATHGEPIQNKQFWVKSQSARERTRAPREASESRRARRRSTKSTRTNLSGSLRPR